MKKWIYSICFVGLFGLCACQKAEYSLFDDIARVRMGWNKEITYNFVYKDRNTVNRDTVYITVRTIGDLASVPRRIALEQVPEYDITYQYDNKGNLIDSLVEEKMNKAIPGIHYVPMDADEMQAHLVVRPRAVSVQVPVILLRDTSLRREEKRLCLKLVATEDFQLGETKELSRVVIISDKLSRPDKWDARVEKNFLGIYSERKHEFITLVAGEKIDDAWFNRINKDFSEKTYFRNKFKDALTEYNNDPKNKEEGLAPMREKEDDPNSPLVFFP